LPPPLVTWPPLPLPPVVGPGNVFGDVVPLQPKRPSPASNDKR
jgi:hypothetical protein